MRVMRSCSSGTSATACAPVRRRRASAPPPARAACARRSARAPSCRRRPPPRPRAGPRAWTCRARRSIATSSRPPAMNQRSSGESVVMLGERSVEPRHDERVRLAGVDLRERPLQRRARPLVARGRGVVDDGAAACRPLAAHQSRSSSAAPRELPVAGLRARRSRSHGPFAPGPGPAAGPGPSADAGSLVRSRERRSTSSHAAVTSGARPSSAGREPVGQRQPDRRDDDPRRDQHRHGTGLANVDVASL